MKMRVDEWIGGIHYYTKCNKYGVWQVMEDIAEELPSEVAFEGSYKECVDWIRIEERKSRVEW